MYRFCASTKVGWSHELKGEICQDNHYCIEKNSIFFAAVADGLTTSKYSHIASKIASFQTVTYCSERITLKMNAKKILSIIRDSFVMADLAIKRRAGGHLNDFDTTLTIAVFIRGSLYYGHVGDSGIIALRCDGTFEEVTEAQHGIGHDNDAPVYPLAANEKWVFAKHPHRIKALFLMTDGMINKVVTPLLKSQLYQLDHAYLFYLYDNLCKNQNLNSWISSEVIQVSPGDVKADDKTLLGAVYTVININMKDEEYYKFPSDELWHKLLLEGEKILYPYRFPDNPLTGYEVDSEPQIVLKKKRFMSKILEKIERLSRANKAKFNK